MDKELEGKYESHKLTVKRWEHEFKKTNKRIPSKVSFKRRHCVDEQKKYFRAVIFILV